MFFLSGPWGLSAPPKGGGEPWGLSAPPKGGGEPWGLSAPPKGGREPWGLSAPPKFSCEIFQKGRAAAPFIVFFYEIAGLAAPRGNSGDSGDSDAFILSDRVLT